MKTLAKLLTLALFISLGLTAVRSLPANAADNAIALVIGNGAYRFHDPLESATRDAAAVAEGLRARGFEVIEELDANNGAFRAALNTFSERLRPGDLALFYFMGYALQSKGRNFLLPVGAELRREFDLLTRGVALDAVRHLMEAAATRANVILLDAAYPDRISAAQDWAGAGLAAASPSDGNTLIAYSAAPETEIAPPGSDGSLFARELGTILDQPVADLGAAVRNLAGRTEAASGGTQQPWIDPSFSGPIPLEEVAVAATSETEESESPSGTQASDQEGDREEPAGDTQEAEATTVVPRPPDPDESTAAADAEAPETPPETETVAETEEPEPEPEPPGIVHERSLTPAQRGRIQQDLRTLGLYRGGIDRSFGPGTRRGIKQLQTSLGEEPTGHLTEAQADALAEQAAQRREEIKAQQAKEEAERKTAEAEKKKAEEEEARKKAEAKAKQKQTATKPLSEVERVIQLAEGGDATAQANLGLRYFHGRGVEKDFEKSRFWYLKAAKQGNANAQTNLGFIFFNGYGVKRNLTTAAKWLLSAAKQGQREAQYNLGMLYENGSGVERNYQEAAKWYQRAAESGIAEARQRIDHLKKTS